MSISVKEKSLIFLDICARIEAQCAELYHFYSSYFEGNQEISTLWKKTALEEENHYKQVRLAMRMIDEIDALILQDTDAVYLIHTKLRQLNTGVRTSPPDLVLALTRAVEMEEHLSFLHVDSAVRFKGDSLQQMFIALRNSDLEHISALKMQLAIETVAMAEMTG